MNVVPYRGRDWVELLQPAADLAREIAQTDFVPKGLRGNPAAITAAILYGDEIGLSPMQSLGRVHVIDGRPALAAETMRALVFAAGHEIQVEESTATRCVVIGRRKDSQATTRVAWTMDDAKRAGIVGKPPWRMYPRQMLFARASAELVRALFPDVVGGFAAAEELDEAPFVEGDDQAAGNGQPETPTPTRRRRQRTTAPTTSGIAPPPIIAEALPPLPGGEPAGGEPGPVDLGGDPGPAPADVPSETPGEFSTKAVPDVPRNAPEPELLTDPQRRRMMALFGERGFGDREHRLAWTRRTIGRPIESANDLTVGEASIVILALEAMGLQREGDAADDDWSA